MPEKIDWREELAEIELEELPPDARRLVLELADRFRREDAASRGAAAYSERAPSFALSRR